MLKYWHGGLCPAFVTADSWYACEKNLKTVKHHGMGVLFAVECNRIVSLEKGSWAQVQQLDIPVDGLLVWLRGFGQVKLFRTRLKDQLRHYIVYLPNEEAYTTFGHDCFQPLHDQHWQIEQYHRLLKQVCNIERFQVRTKVAISNHIFASLASYVQLQQMRMSQFISNAYQWQRDLYKNVIADFIQSFVTSADHLNPQFRNSVNA